MPTPIGHSPAGPWCSSRSRFLEHLALTIAVATTGKPIGLSTAFVLHPGPALWSCRIWWHLIAKLVPSALTLRVLWWMGTTPGRNTPVIVETN